MISGRNLTVVPQTSLRSLFDVERCPRGNDQRDKFGDQLPNGGARRFCITWETSERVPVNESTESSVSPIHVFSVSLGLANYGFEMPSTYERALEESPNGKLLVVLHLRGPHRSNQW
jgi:hypothetical protein